MMVKLYAEPVSMATPLIRFAREIVTTPFPFCLLSF